MAKNWLSRAASEGGGYSEACTVEARDGLLVVHAAPGAASWLMLAGGTVWSIIPLVLRERGAVEGWSAVRHFLQRHLLKLMY